MENVGMLNGNGSNSNSNTFDIVYYNLNKIDHLQKWLGTLYST